ncbi:c-type cytochrome [Pseudomonas aeruginosa]|uniref:c-type cytochrome n=1 Tax=Pseudomonas aeruginosa TaxID=287 RepID=UPI000EB23F1A|nr:cytochrome c [Pseudomonas aeruginosa]NNB83817.1 cytochrome c [Pseudomonas aeruginosa]
MKVQAITLAALLCSVALGSAAVNAADAEKGKAKFALCASCHGGDGNTATMPGYPKIGGQDEKYLKNALTAYREGRRQGTYASIMAETAKTLSDADIEDLAAYVSSLHH